jgi:tRNA-specific 2-thiouridylase
MENRKWKRSPEAIFHFPFSIFQASMKKTVLLGMSGGVDSSVSAALLVKKGYRVIGGFIKNWSDTKDAWSGECAWRGDRRDAMRVAAALEIPLVTFDFEDLYRARVIAPMFKAYARGVTPNPDVLCNQEIKFGVFFEAAKRLKADFVATGHYARVRHGRDGMAHLLRGSDPDKDQSYFLHRVSQSALRKTIFPVGSLQKKEVRAIARRFNLSTAVKAESMGICFIGKQPMTAFLRTRIPSKPGMVVDPNGKTIGTHDGLDGVTIGQRHGFHVTVGGGPWYAAAKDISSGCLVAVPGREHPRLYSESATVADVHWIADVPRSDRRLSVAVRYRQDAVPVTCEIKKGHRVRVSFRFPVFAVAPGQSAVFYRGEECLGGGMIE